MRHINRQRTPNFNSISSFVAVTFVFGVHGASDPALFTPPPPPAQWLCPRQRVSLYGQETRQSSAMRDDEAKANTRTPRHSRTLPLVSFY